MDKNLIKAINHETSKFYIKHAAEFSGSRQHAWPGWEQLAKIISKKFVDSKNIKVLDIGCGNMRFEKFLESLLPHVQIQCRAIDNCDRLQNAFTLNNTKVYFCNIDIIESLLDEQNFVEDDNFDLVVSFGLMHHIPCFELRLMLIKYLIGIAKPQAVLAFSFWNYFNDKKLKAKAIKATKGAIDKLNIDTLDLNDKFMTWSNDTSVYRYCHNFSDDEIDKIIKSIEERKVTKLLCSYISDGKSNNLNRYLVFEKLY